MDPDRAHKPIDADRRGCDEVHVLDLGIIQNTPSHISSIPDEVLVNIFFLVQGSVNNVHQWHQFTHVCRHWRCVALGTASLWTNPPTHLQSYAIVMLERSRECSLDITLDCNTSTLTTAAALKHIKRIRSLAIVRNFEALQAFQDTLSISRNDALQLHKLRINSRFYIHANSVPTFKLLASTINPRTPLATLDLIGIDLDWQIFPIQSLTSLSLVVLEVSHPPSWTQFLGALSGMPLLEYLRVSFDMLKLTSQPCRQLEAVQMPHIRHLDITWSSASDINTFLGHTMYPHLRKAYFECSTEKHNADPRDYTAATGAVISLMACGDFGSLNELIVGNDRFLLLKKGGKRRDRCEQEFWCTPASPHNTRLPYDGMAAVTSLLRNHPAEIRHLTGLEHYTSEQLIEFFGQLSRLESIQARTSSVEILKSITVTPSQADKPTWFPCLKEINLKTNDYCPDFFEDLCSCLLFRQESGFGIQKLSVNWDLTPDEARRLQEIVVDLTWKTSVPNFWPDSEED